ncbi:unnamed protein product [Paramecium octaurelia]|uniref:Uncharacterized protein n=1 Tax=Paramecium octaurelia TaxID=43137 RepID=A0A8S1U8L3_PAROT|nr:unnamed protein product [Paramecium octaurelia]
MYYKHTSTFKKLDDQTKVLLYVNANVKYQSQQYFKIVLDNTLVKIQQVQINKQMLYFYTLSRNIKKRKWFF